MGELLKKPAKDHKIVGVAGTRMVQHIPTILLVWGMEDIGRYIGVCKGCMIQNTVEQTNISIVNTL